MSTYKQAFNALIEKFRNDNLMILLIKILTKMLNQEFVTFQSQMNVTIIKMRCL